MKPQTSMTENFHAFQGCRTCRGRPCGLLRFGRVHPGKFLFVHRRYLGFGEKGCPFVVQSFSEVKELVRDISLLDLIDRIEDILSRFSVEEQHLHNQAAYVAGYDDVEGRIHFLEALWNDNILGVVRVPFAFNRDKKLTQWLFAGERP